MIDAAKAAATALIDACRDFVVAALEGFGELLKGLVDNLLGDIFPGLAAALTDFIDSAVDLAVSAVNAIADALKDGINALLDGLKGAITAALEAYRAAINAAIAIAQAVVTGDWAELARKMLEAALQLAGIDPDQFMGMVGSAMDSIDSIIDDPGGFIGNVIDAVGTGFGQFADNFLGHLQNGFFEWLAGPLGGAGITLPSNWDLEGIFGLVMQVLGLTQDGIRGIISEEFGETAGALFDYAWRYIGALISGGIEGLWGEIQGDLSNLWGMVVDGIKGWLVETIVTQAVIRIAGMFNPAGALIQAIMAVWDVVTWLQDNVQRIYGVISAVVEGMAGLVAGEVAPVANLVEGQLANLIAPAIDLLAGLLGLDGLADRIQEIIEGIRETVRNAIKSLIARVRSMFDEEGGDEQTPEDLPGDPRVARVRGHARRAPGVHGYGARGGRPDRGSPRVDHGVRWAARRDGRVGNADAHHGAVGRVADRPGDASPRSDAAGDRRCGDQRGPVGHDGAPGLARSGRSRDGRGCPGAASGVDPRQGGGGQRPARDRIWRVRRGLRRPHGGARAHGAGDRGLRGPDLPDLECAQLRSLPGSHRDAWAGRFDGQQHPDGLLRGDEERRRERAGDGIRTGHQCAGGLGPCGVWRGRALLVGDQGHRCRRGRGKRRTHPGTGRGNVLRRAQLRAAVE